MKGKKHGLAWYVGMVFGDPASLADPDAPGLPPGGPRWTYVAMWAVIGSVLGFLPALVLWRIYWASPEPPEPVPQGVTTVFDGTYVRVEGRVIDDRKLIGRCSSDGPSGGLTISDGIVHFTGSRFVVEVGADGGIRFSSGPSLYVLQADRRGTVQGTYETRDCSYHLLWQKE